jgi:hypothetical protein
VKSSPGQVFGWHLSNTGASGVFVKLYDTAEAPVIGSKWVLTAGLTLRGAAKSAASGLLP